MIVVRAVADHDAFEPLAARQVMIKANNNDAVKEPVDFAKKARALTDYKQELSNVKRWVQVR